MPWGRVDDDFYDHPKVLALPEAIRNAACGLYWRAISYANAKLTDGFISTEVDRQLEGSSPQLGLDLTTTSTLADALVKARLWHKKGKGYVIHDFLTFNKCRDQVVRERDIRAQSGHLGGVASGATRRSKREANAKQDASIVLPDNEANAKQTRSTIEPRPGPSHTRPIDSPPSPRKRGANGRREDGESPRQRHSSPRQEEAKIAANAPRRLGEIMAGVAAYNAAHPDEDDDAELPHFDKATA